MGDMGQGHEHMEGDSMQEGDMYVVVFCLATGFSLLVSPFRMDFRVHGSQRPQSTRRTRSVSPLTRYPCPFLAFCVLPLVEVM